MKNGLIRSTNTMSFKVRMALIVVAIVPLLIYTILNNFILSSRFQMMEEEDLTFKINQADAVLKNRAEGIGKIARGYALWSSAYTNIMSESSRLLIHNIAVGLADNFSLDILAAVNTSGQIVDEAGITGMPAELINDPLVQGLLRGGSAGQMPLQGFKLYNGELYIVGISPIYGGAVILGEKVTEDSLNSIWRQYGYNIFIIYGDKLINNKSGLDNIDYYYKHYASPQVEELTITDGSKIMGSKYIYDISGNKIGKLYIIQSRDAFLSAKSAVHKNGGLVLTISLAIIFLLSIRLKQKILYPIKNLETEITKMEQNNTLNHIKPDGFQEIISLTNTFNHMADSINHHRKENERLKNFSRVDNLTLLYNNQYFFEMFQKKISSGAERLTIVLFDIDHLNIINDRYGRNIGDKVLVEFGEIIKSAENENLIGFRYGGDEFVILLQNYSDEQIKEVKCWINSIINESTIIKKFLSSQQISTSIGTASYPTDGDNIKELLDKAGQDIDSAKKRNRGSM